MYNAKVIGYREGVQVRFYNYICPGKQSKDGKKHKSYLKEYREWRKKEENPFTGEREYIPEIDDLRKNRERSREVSMNRTKNRSYSLARSNSWDWFVTLTFDSEKVDRYDYSVVSKKLSKWLNNCRKKCPDMKYLVIPELHKDGAFHFHGLFSNCDGLGFVDSGLLKDGKIIYNIGSYRLGFTTATEVESDQAVVRYITKYITKELCAATFGKRRYWASRNLEEAEEWECLLTVVQRFEMMDSMASGITWGKTVNSPVGRCTYFELDPGGGEVAKKHCAAARDVVSDGCDPWLALHGFVHPVQKSGSYRI